ncbi:MAG: hypothetical protein JF606_24145 [Burkholderiales bacterium]|nr:hypothetical protein [Burkholderiales bacterium]
MQSRPILRKALRSLAVAAAVASAFAGGVRAAADAPPHTVQDPHYGDGLFHFFQDRYFSSITSLMVSQHFERMPHHADEAEILRGGMLLSYGLHREAGEIFAKLIETGAKPAVRDRAWYFLAKIRYQRGFLAEAEDAMNRIENHLPPEFEEDRGLLKANMLMARGDFAGAAKALNAMATAKDASRYARFNLAVALIKSGDSLRGTAMLDELGRAPAANEESRSLRDKANVALGFTALQENRAENARTYLERVRLNGMQSNKALLGFGWAADALKQPRQALVPWTELAQRDVSDSAVLEARIAVPYAYAALGAYSQALQQYTDAIEVFDKESAGLDESIAAIRAGKFVEGLLESNPGDEMGWFWKIGSLPEMTHAGHLTQVLAQHEFQEAFKNLRDLQFLSRNLQDWKDKLGVFGDMLANRRNAYAERLPKVLEKARVIGIEALQKRRDDLAKEMARAQERQDGVAFANEKELDLLARIDSVQSILKQAGEDAEMNAARERARLASGALTWRLADQYAARLWDAQKGMKIIDTALDEARRRDAALAQAQKDEPARHEKYAQRIVELDKRIQALIPRVAALSKEQQQVVQEIAVAELTRQKERLAEYATQARFAVAQLYDRANPSRDADDAIKP